MKFYLGFDNPASAKGIIVPVMLSCRPIIRRKKPVLNPDWIMDSGGFTELSINGEYTISESEYIECIKRLKPSFAFCQDWMCEDFVLEATKKTVKEHQKLTIESYMSMSQKINVVPVLQGYWPDEYVEHCEMYRNAGVDMSQLFGVGSICARNRTEGVYTVLRRIKEASPKIKLHAFGLKITALRNANLVNITESTDSQAWSFDGRRNGPTKRCRHCQHYALAWRAKVVRVIELSKQRGIQIESPF